MAKRGWHPESTKSQVWKLVESAGWNGIRRIDLLRALPVVSESAVDLALADLQRGGHLRKAAWGHYVADADMVPPIEGLAEQRALQMIDDCPHGISELIMCAELKVGPTQLRATLAAAEAAGRIERMMLPAQHGGGLGFRLRRVAGDVPPPMPMSEMAHPDMRVPVMTVDIDRIHNVHRRDLFDAELRPDGRLRITSGSVTMELPKHHTAALCQYLLQPATPGDQEYTQ